ncbi:MAG: DUF72 domain-containing protein [Phycisphaerales bacterium]
MAPSIRFGTSSWAFPGWRGEVFGKSSAADRLARFGLAAYSRYPLFRTVGLDRAFYSLLTEADACELAALVPDDFRFLVKCHQTVCRPFATEAGDTFGDTRALAAGGLGNPRFLDASYATDVVIGPLAAGFRNRLGPIVFQFPPLGVERHGGPQRFLDRLGAFLAALPRGPLYAVETRDREFLGTDLVRDYATALRAANVMHGFAVHPTLPSIAAQAASLDRAEWPIEAQPALTMRWLLGHGQGYDEAKLRYDPFDRIVAPDPASRHDILGLLRRAEASNRLAWVIANNKAEGSAPLTIELLAKAMVGK